MALAAFKKLLCFGSTRLGCSLLSCLLCRLQSVLASLQGCIDTVDFTARVQQTFFAVAAINARSSAKLGFARTHRGALRPHSMISGGWKPA